MLTVRHFSDIIYQVLWREPFNLWNLGVAQLVARYLGVVEAASSSLVTQTKTRVHNEPSFFFCFLANPREISRFRNITNGLVIPCSEGWTSPFFTFDHMFDHLGRFLHYFLLYCIDFRFYVLYQFFKYFVCFKKLFHIVSIIIKRPISWFFVWRRTNIHGI